jgi:hypothetical protein
MKAEPKRSGNKPKTKSSTNAHVLVEFGLQVSNVECFTKTTHCGLCW